MNRNNKNLIKYFGELSFLVLTCLLFFFTSIGALAEDNSNLPVPADQIREGNEKTSVTAFPDDKVINSPANCFDYYHFQSVQVSLDVDKKSYQPGETIKFEGNLINENSYPIFNGYVFVRISRENKDYMTEGNYIVDEFIPLKKVVLDEQETKPVSFSWEIPDKLARGDYRADFFFSVGKRFNLGGLPFSNEVIVGFTEFSVKSNNNFSIYFDRSNTKVNGKKYQQIGGWPVVLPGKKIIVSQPILNTYQESKKIKITYGLSYWGGLDRNNLLSTKTEEKIIPADSSLELKYIIPEAEESVYYLKIIADDRAGQKSIINIRVLSPQEKPRINFPAITKFPIKGGDKFTLFSCFHNTSRLNTKGHLIVSLLDKEGDNIGQVDYRGEISSAMMADKKDLIAKRDYNYLKLIAKLYDKNNRLADSYSVIYDCQALNKCPTKAKNNSSLNIKIISFLIIILLLVAIISIVFINQKKHHENQ